MPEELAFIGPIIVGLAILFAVVAVLGFGVTWLLAHPAVIVVFTGLIIFLVWRSARRNRV